MHRKVPNWLADAPAAPRALDCRRAISAAARVALFAILGSASFADRDARAQGATAGGVSQGMTGTPGGSSSGAGNTSGAAATPQAPAAALPIAPTPIYGQPVYGAPSGPVVDPNSHLPSSSQPSNDTSRASDYFDFSQSAAGAPTLHGDPNGSFNAAGQIEPAPPPPNVHVVQRGDTLWDVCDRYFHNPWEWPKIWSYNPELQNPHWIFPGDQLRLVPKEAPLSEGTRAAQPAVPSAIGFARKRQVQPSTVFLRDQGYIDDKLEGVWGEVGGSPEDQLLLSEGDSVYLDIAKDHDVAVGQELTIFRPIKGRIRGDVKGTLVAIIGTARVDKWDRDSRVARATLTESLDVIERGSKVGPVGRRFDVVPAVRNDVELWAHVSASLYPYELYGQNQVVFIDKGQGDGLVVGNRLFVITRGDEYRKTLFGASDYAAASVQYESEKPATVEKDGARGHGDEQKYPEEVIGEIRVMKVREHTATCLVVSAIREIEPGERVVARRGY
jgi:hypothetical protein